MDETLEENIVINVKFMGRNAGSLTEVQVVPCNIAWEDFELMLKVYADQEQIRVKYVDDDNDDVMIGSETELQEAFKVAKKANNTLSLKVFCTQPLPRNPDDGTGIWYTAEHNVENVDGGESRECVREVTANVEDQTVALKITIENDKVTLGTETIPPEKQTETPVAMDIEEKDEAQPQAAASSPEKKESPAKEPRKPRFFFLKNKTTGLVMDVEGQNPAPGTRVILWGRKPPGGFLKNQLWYEHKETGTIRSALHNLCLDVRTDKATVQPYKEGRVSQLWGLTEGRLLNTHNPILTIIAPRLTTPGAMVTLGNTQEKHRHGLWVKEHRDAPKKVTNNETGEMCALLAQVASQGARPKKAKGRSDPYARLAEAVSQMNHGSGGDSPEGATCLESGEKEEMPPTWFQFYMNKFKQEISEDIAKMVARKTVKEVLKGLEGAVITSVRGSDGLGPLEEMFAAAASTIVPKEGRTDDDSPGQPVYCHMGIICDHCERTIVGARFKCGNCKDFDLCEECEGGMEGIHDPSHVFIKIRRPIISAGRNRNGKLAPLIMRNLYTGGAHESEPMSDDDSSRDAERQKRVHEREMKRAQKLEEKTKQRESKTRKREEKSAEKAKRRSEDKLKRHLQVQEDLQEVNKELLSKRERLDLPQFKAVERMDAEFVQDESIPDGTEVQPGTKLTKRWTMRNTGTHPWTSKTVLKMMWGNMHPTKAEVTVPYLQPGDVGTVSTELLAPEEPGTYQSHWRLSHHGKRFGHRVWCSIVVVAREMLEVAKETAGPSSIDLKVVDEKVENAEATSPEAAAAQLKSPTQGDATRVIDADILTAQDILSFEMLDIKGKGVSTAKVSQTATPNNTPLVVSPPKSPVPEAEPELVTSPIEEEEELPPLQQHLSESSSSVEIVGEDEERPLLGDRGVTEEESSDWNTELVQERMAHLGLRPDLDVESLSSGLSDDDLDSCDSDSDFYIVPIPDCFNPNLPLSKSASTSVIVKKDDDDEKTVDDLLTASNSLESQPLLQPTTVQVPLVTIDDPQVPVVIMDDPQDEEDIMEDPQMEQDGKEEDEQEVQIVCVVPAPEGATCAAVKQEEPVIEQMDGPLDAPTEETLADVETDGMALEENTEPKTSGGQSSPTVASSLVTAAVGIAHQAAAQAYSTAKDVFHTLQARNQYVPPKSNWTPPHSDWTPPGSTWTPPGETWTPPQEEWTPPTTEPERTPMDTLLEMGFANRELNKKLLDKYENNLDRVIQDLVQSNENDWSEARH